MPFWPAADLFEFSRLFRLLDDCFVLRRTFQPLEPNATLGIDAGNCPSRLETRSYF
jgi:hypothetical protein